ncbi:uncharacterized protein LOC106738278 [Alligator mississippiensis]|uniref:Ig-like domain-containing protein n=1 Tax=Alligator mississippiensis TaxID=8496 RepID=A0A151MAR7_ALLMI|nr:uncharacterized protein LOC106738278 [Alligator mississippiensis]KYO21591.1 hypothetical protein Y1Q_0004536 [Alligator mississippiensis]
MCCPWAGILLLTLQVAASQKRLRLQQSPAEIWTTPGQTVQLNCTVSDADELVTWYKECRDGSLQSVSQNAKSLPEERKYSSKVSSSGKAISLVISDVREEDSGVYYCAFDIYVDNNFRNRTRLIVSDAPQPSLAILMPLPTEETELPDTIPLLCLLSPYAQAWGAPLWDVGEGSTLPADAGALHGEGAWSLTTVPKERWDAGTHYTCWTREQGTGRKVSTITAKAMGITSKGPCWVVRWVGLPCVCLLLLIQVLILLSTRCPRTAGTVAAPGSDVHPRQSPETEYAAVRHGGRNASV